MLSIFLDYTDAICFTSQIVGVHSELVYILITEGVVAGVGQCVYACGHGGSGRRGTYNQRCMCALGYSL